MRENTCSIILWLNYVLLLGLCIGTVNFTGVSPMIYSPAAPFPPCLFWWARKARRGENGEACLFLRWNKFGKLFPRRVGLWLGENTECFILLLLVYLCQRHEGIFLALYSENLERCLKVKTTKSKRASLKLRLSGFSHSCDSTYRASNNLSKLQSNYS